MKIHEYLAKGTLFFHGIKIPTSKFYDSYVEENISFLPCVLKSQVLVGSRMKNGGVLFAKSRKEFLNFLKELTEKPIRGETPDGVLVEELVDIRHEYYVSLLLGRKERDLILCFSEKGGIDVEENAENVVSGPFDEIIKSVPEILRETIFRMKNAFESEDMIYLEINPLAVAGDGQVYALDCVMDLDENAFFRKTVHTGYSFPAEENPGFHFVELTGDIGIIGCGAGIVMATMDAVKMYGGEPADFLDIGGGAGKETVIKALEMLSRKGLEKILLNIFGGITSCDEVAEGILSFKKAHEEVRLYIRMAGNKAEEATDMLNLFGINCYDNVYEMVRSCLQVGDEYALR